MSANQKKRGENMLSVIIPAYNEEKMIQTTADTVDRILSEASVPYEIVFVNDGSKDGTWQQIETAAEKNPHVNGLHFSRNFGKESAIFAGLANAEGDCCRSNGLRSAASAGSVGFHVPSLGAGIRSGRRGENEAVEKKVLIHRACAGLFYKMMSKAVKIDMSRASDFQTFGSQGSRCPA